MKMKAAEAMTDEAAEGVDEGSEVWGTVVGAVGVAEGAVGAAGSSLLKKL